MKLWFESSRMVNDSLRFYNGTRSPRSPWLGFSDTGKSTFWGIVTLTSRWVESLSSNWDGSQFSRFHGSLHLKGVFVYHRADREYFQNKVDRGVRTYCRNQDRAEITHNIRNIPNCSTQLVCIACLAEELGYEVIALVANTGFFCHLTSVLLFVYNY